ncbi:MAG TPA: gamma carbonic anhydrase family protein [Myxococcales bacterium]|nr:gamma carbonic anhydrase family protein [Myxococcales bacterium]
MVIGDAHLAADSSIWYGTVLRADVGTIRIGKGSNIQDNSVIHVETGTWNCSVGDYVTVGHRVMLHGCQVGDDALVGIGAIVLNGAEIGAGSIIGAASLVTQGMKIPPGVLALGSPCRVKRELTAEEKEHLKVSALHYIELAREHR